MSDTHLIMRITYIHITITNTLIIPIHIVRVVNIVSILLGYQVGTNTNINYVCTIISRLPILIIVNTEHQGNRSRATHLVPTSVHYDQPHTIIPITITINTDIRIGTDIVKVYPNITTILTIIIIRVKFYIQ